MAINLRDLYEGTPQYVVKHFHKFAVSENEVKHDRQKYGERHIGLRAEEVITSFLALTESLTELAYRLSMLFQQEDLCGLTSNDVRYNGWWTMPGLQELGYVVPLSITQDTFLDRCVLLYQLFERIKPGPLKQILQQLGMEKTDFKTLEGARSVKLLGAICQFALLAKTSGLKLITDFSSLKDILNKDTHVESLEPLFALVNLRNQRSHPHGSDRDENINTSLKAFKLHPSEMKKGWGQGVDRVYDTLATSFHDVTNLIHTSIG